MALLSRSVLHKYAYNIIKNLNKNSKPSLSPFKVHNNHYNVYSTNVLKKLNFIDLDNNTYERICSETLESLTEYFEEIVEKDSHFVAADVSYGDGVLTVNLGDKHGIYVINRQTPNKQIWLSSPTSGPKRYDYATYNNSDKVDDGCWIYKHNGESLHELLQNEIKMIIKCDLNFFKLPYSGS